MKDRKMLRVNPASEPARGMDVCDRIVTGRHV